MRLCITIDTPDISRDDAIAMVEAIAEGLKANTFSLPDGGEGVIIEATDSDNGTSILGPYEIGVGPR